jgi:hypothetical protein
VTKGVHESDVSIPGFEYDARCPYCGGDLRIIMGERLGTLAVPVDLAPVVTDLTPSPRRGTGRRHPAVRSPDDRDGFFSSPMKQWRLAAPGSARCSSGGRSSGR